MKTWLDKWDPEDDAFWSSGGSKIAWKTLTITTITLLLSFASWFMMSVIAVKLPGLGFNFSKDQRTIDAWSLKTANFQTRC